MAGEESDIVEEQLEQISLLGQFQRIFWLLHIVCRQGDTCVPKPQEAVAVPIELEILIEILENEAFVLRVQLRRNQIEDVVQVQFIPWIIFGDILLVKFDDGFLFLFHQTQIVGVNIFEAAAGIPPTTR